MSYGNSKSKHPLNLPLIAFISWAILGLKARRLFELEEKRRIFFVIILCHKLRWRNHPASHLHHEGHLWASLWYDGYENSAFPHLRSRLGWWKLCSLEFQSQIWHQWSVWPLGELRNPAVQGLFLQGGTKVLLPFFSFSFTNVGLWRSENDKRKLLLLCPALNSHINIYSKPWVEYCRPLFL